MIIGWKNTWWIKADRVNCDWGYKKEFVREFWLGTKKFLIIFGWCIVGMWVKKAKMELKNIDYDQKRWGWKNILSKLDKPRGRKKGYILSKGKWKDHLKVAQWYTRLFWIKRTELESCPFQNLYGFSLTSLRWRRKKKKHFLRNLSDYLKTITS